MDNRQVIVIDNIINERFESLEKWLKQAVNEVITVELSVTKQLLKEFLCSTLAGTKYAEIKQKQQ